MPHAFLAGRGRMRMEGHARLRAWLTVAAAIAIGAPANAAGPAVRGQDEGSVIKVQYTEGDLHTVQGARSLAGRVRLAADRACRAEALFASGPSAMAECREKAITQAVKALKAPLLEEALGLSTRPPAA